MAPVQACQMLGIGRTRLYELLAKDELRSYCDGKSRKITVDSIHDFVARRLAAAETTDTHLRPPPERELRGRK